MSWGMFRMSPTELHVAPASEFGQLVGDHELSPWCACNPVPRQPCPECNSDNADCWRCQGVGDVEPFTDDMPIMYAHNDPDWPGSN